MIREKIRVVFAFTLIVIGIASLYYCSYEREWLVISRRFNSMDFLLMGGSVLLVIAGLASFKRWKWYSREALVAIALSIIPTLILIQATFLFINEFDRFFKPYVGFLFWIGRLGLFDFFGYASFAAMVVLIIVGFLVKKGKLSILGSSALYLPTFGQLMFSMWGYFGMGTLAVLWMPLYDFCPQVLSLGNIVLLPHLCFPYRGDWYFRSFALIYVVAMLGIAILSLGTIVWLFGKFKGYEIIDFGIYRYSRHPQYLGLLLWSYGLLLLITNPISLNWPPRPGLPWLLLALTTIGIALQEESGMVKKYGEKYLEYRNNTPFMFPLPKQVSRLMRAPVKAIFKKDWPENRKEIACTIAIYGLALILLSVLIVQLAEVFPILKRIR